MLREWSSQWRIILLRRLKSVSYTHLDVYKRQVYVFTFPKFKADQIAFSVFGLIYVPVLMMHLYQIRELPDGLFIIPLVFLSAWGNDTCAYCVGMLIGKHRCV